MEHNWEGLRAYVDSIQFPLRLGTYEISFNDMSTGGAHNIGQCTVLAGYYHALVEFSELFWERAKEDQQEDIVHELMHIHVHRLFNHFEDAQDHINLPAYDLWMKGVRVTMEEVTDTLSRMVSPMLPPLREKLT